MDGVSNAARMYGISSEIAFKNKADEVIYNYIKTNGFITRHQILEITNITTTTGVSVAFNRLIEVGLVKSASGQNLYISIRK